MKKYINKSNFETFELVDNVVERVVDAMNDGEYEDIDDCIGYEIDNALMYYDDQWEVMKHYQLPKEANFDNAIEEFINDVYANIGEEEVEEEEEE